MVEPISRGVPSAVVALAGARDGFQVPAALAEAGLLDRLVTDAHWPSRNLIVSGLGFRLLPQTALRKRSHPALGADQVEVPWSALIPAALARAFPAGRIMFDRRKDLQLGQHARRQAAVGRSALLCYSYYAFGAFRPGRGQPRHRILFQVHPDPASVRRILQDEIERTPHAAASLRAELELATSDAGFNRLRDEQRLATGIIAASSFTARSLVKGGIPDSLISVVPYGVDRDRYRPRRTAPDPNNHFRVIFAGSMVQRKGLSDLFDAMRLLRSHTIDLTLCGRGFIDRALLAAYSDVPTTIHTGLSDERFVAEIQRSDVLVLPSLAEGFGHVILEAMACGVPVITTPNTGGPDVIDDGVEGFIVPIRSTESLADKIAWGVAHRDALAEMGRAAARRAELFTWERFRREIVRAYAKLTSDIC